MQSNLQNRWHVAAKGNTTACRYADLPTSNAQNSGAKADKSHNSVEGTVDLVVTTIAQNLRSRVKNKLHLVAPDSSRNKASSRPAARYEEGEEVQEEAGERDVCTVEGGRHNHP